MISSRWLYIPAVDDVLRAAAVYFYPTLTPQTNFPHLVFPGYREKERERHLKPFIHLRLATLILIIITIWADFTLNLLDSISFSFFRGLPPWLKARASTQRLHPNWDSWIILQPNSQCQIFHITMRGEQWKWQRWPHYLSLSLCANCVQSDLCHKCNGVSLTHSWQGVSCRECRRLTCNWWTQPLDLLLSFKVDGC